MATLQDNMDDIPKLLLVPKSAFVNGILPKLSSRDRSHVALACKHTHSLVNSTVKCLTFKDAQVCLGQHRVYANFPNCNAMVLRLRTMDQFSKVLSEVLLKISKRMPQLAELVFELQDVYAAQCDLSLSLTSVVVHAPQVTHLRISQPGTLDVRETKAIAKMQQLSSMTLLSHGLEPGALAELQKLAGEQLNLTQSAVACCCQPRVLCTTI